MRSQWVREELVASGLREANVRLREGLEKIRNRGRGHPAEVVVTEVAFQNKLNVTPFFFQHS